LTEINNNKQQQQNPVGVAHIPGYLIWERGIFFPERAFFSRKIWSGKPYFPDWDRSRLIIAFLHQNYKVAVSPYQSWCYFMKSQYKMIYIYYFVFPIIIISLYNLIISVIPNLIATSREENKQTLLGTSRRKSSIWKLYRSGYKYILQ
jgi:hypothetical protein